jgi:hypothetical protein
MGIMPNEVSRIARKVQSDLRAIGVRSTIATKDGLPTVSGTDTKGKPFAVRLRHCADMDEVGGFVEECDAVRVHKRKPGDFILVRLV